MLALVPVVVVLDWIGAAGKLTIFVLAAAALIPLAWLIGEATDNAAYYTGPGVGGFLNATFGNAPELIIALVAVSDGLTEVVKASLVGSIAGNLLLVLGFTLLFGQRGSIDRRSAAISLGMVALTTVLILVTSVPGFHGDADRRSLAVLSLPVAVLLLLVRIVVNRYALRRQRALQAAADPVGEAGWPFRVALGVLGVATVVTAFVTNSLVGSLQAFASQAHLSEFFVAIVIVAIVGNATEHGSAVMLARRGRVRLATEISLASSAQVAGTAHSARCAGLVGDHAARAQLPPDRARRASDRDRAPCTRAGQWEDDTAGRVVLLLAYAGLVTAFYYAGDR